MATSSGDATGMCIYISGGITSILSTFAVLRPLCTRSEHKLCCVGSSGGALLVAFLSLGVTTSGERRRFSQLCKDLPAAVNWNSLHELLRAWVREITGGAACTMKQWRARFGPLQVLVYDYARAKPVLVDANSSCRTVAFVLASCLLHDTPAYVLPANLPEHWMDVEYVIPPCTLCKAIQPPVALHFTSVSMLEEKSEGNVAAQVLHLQEKALRSPLQHLTWQTVCLAPESNFGSLLHPKGWSSLLRARRTLPPDFIESSGDVECVKFALGFIVWVVVLLTLAAAPINPFSVQGTTVTTI